MTTNPQFGFVETVGRELKRCSTLDTLCSDTLARATPSVYSSFDIRDAGFKIAPVDANLFPAGWNNLADDRKNEAAPLFRSWFQKYLGISAPCRLLVVSENHTENRFYFENLFCLSKILEKAGFDVRLGFWQHPSWAETQSMTSFKGEKFVIHPITICACKISLPEKWTPDVVLFNNDCSQNPGDIWDYVHVPVVPSTAFGWHRRKKSWFFESWNRHAERFASCLSLDSWYFKVRTERVGPVDFKTDVGMKCLVESVDRVIQSVADDYRAHKIDRQPAVFIKHASGTYGMGVMTVKNSAELLQLNRKTRNKMSVGKGKRFIDEVIVQEAIPSAMRSEIPDEPVIYAVGYGVVGGFMRTNQTRTVDENLNSQGMQFAPLSRLPPHIVDVYKSIGFQCTVALAQEMVAYGPHDEKDIE